MNNRKKAAVGLILAIALKNKRRRKCWVKDWMLKRSLYSHLNITQEMLLGDDSDDYNNYFRMSEDVFEKLLTMVSPYITKQDTQLRRAVSPRDKLAVTLRYIATGRSFKCLRYSSFLSAATISEAVISTCRALIYVLKDYIKIPTTAEGWIEIANEFGRLYKFCQCIGCLDGKHIEITKPEDSGPLYYNYKGYYSIVLMALVNARKEFIMIDVGTNGKVSDGGVLFYTKFCELYEKQKLNLPVPCEMPNSTTVLPYVFLADEAFALGVNLMKPYSQKSMNAEEIVFNKRLSSARQVVECAFGLLATKFRVFHTPINLEPEKATIVTTASFYLHNFLLKHNDKQYVQATDNQHTKCNFAASLDRNHNRNANTDAKTIRAKFRKYFFDEERGRSGQNAS